MWGYQSRSSPQQRLRMHVKTDITPDPVAERILIICTGHEDPLVTSKPNIWSSERLAQQIKSPNLDKIVSTKELRWPCLFLQVTGPNVQLSGTIDINSENSCTNFMSTAFSHMYVLVFPMFNWFWTTDLQDTNAHTHCHERRLEHAEKSLKAEVTLASLRTSRQIRINSTPFYKCVKNSILVKDLKRKNKLTCDVNKWRCNDWNALDIWTQTMSCDQLIFFFFLKLKSHVQSLQLFSLLITSTHLQEGQ